MDDSMQDAGKSGGGWRALDSALAAVTLLALVAAAACAALYLTNRVPDGAAAKVGEHYLYEDDLAAYIQQYRAGNGLLDDADFAQALLSSSYNVSTFRQSCINQMALNMLVDERAEELGVTPDEADVDELYDQTKQDFAMESDDIWEATLADQGMTEEGVRAQLSTRLAQTAVFEADVARREATDEQVLSYIQTAKAGQTLRHSYRILFTGKGQWERAQECRKALEALGNPTLEAFQGLVALYSDDAEAESSGGAYGWDDAQDMAEDYRDILMSLSEGEVSEPTSIDSEDAAVIVFCDRLVEFPSADKIDGLRKSDVPEDAWDYLADEAADGLWATDCNAYLANLLTGAKITYYPIPDGAAYDVDMALAVQEAE